MSYDASREMMRRLRKHRAMSLVLATFMAPRIARAVEPVDDVVVLGNQSSGFSSRAGVDDAPREVTDAASLVEPLPGVHVRRLGADDSFATLSIRGSTSTQVSILFAGVPLSGGADPTLDLATLPLWPGSHARVYRSFAPAALGQGSLGGTLALDPLSVNTKPGTDVWAAVGSFGARRVRIGDVRALDDGSRVVTALSASRSDGDFTYLDPSATTAAGSDVFATRQNAGHAALNALVAWSTPVRWSATRSGTLTVTTMAQARRQGLPGPLPLPTPFAQLDSNRELAAIELAVGAGRGAWIARAWGRREDLRLRNDTLLASDGPGTLTSDTIVATGGAFGWRGRFADDVRVEARVDGSGERFSPGSYSGVAQAAGATRAAIGAGADVEWRAIDRVTLSGSARFDGWRDVTDDPTTPDSTELRPTGHIGGEIVLGSFAIAAHGGAVARPPSFVERYGNHGGFIGDPHLRTESAWTTDGGVRYAEKLGPVRVDFTLAGFATWADNLITFVALGAYGRAKATNIGHARLVGAEAEARARFADFDLRASYTGLATANLAACGGLAVDHCDRPPLPGRPTADFVADAAYSFGPARVRWGVDVLAGITTDLTGNVPVPTRVLHSVGARLDVPRARGLRVALDVRNLFDERIATYAGITGPAHEPIGDLYQYPLPGRSFLVSVRYATPPPDANAR